MTRAPTWVRRYRRQAKPRDGTARWNPWDPESKFMENVFLLAVLFIGLGMMLPWIVPWILDFMERLP